MPALILPHRFTQQPQGAVEVDRDNDLTRGLVLVQLPASSGQANIVSGKAPNTYAPSGQSVGGHGAALAFDGTTTGIQHAKGGIDLSSAAGMSALVLFNAASTTSGTLLSHNDGGVVPLNLFTGVSTSLRLGGYRSETGGNDGTRRASDTIALNTDYVATWVYADDLSHAVPTVRLNGKNQSIVTTYGPNGSNIAIGAPTTEVAVGANSGGASGRFNGKIYLACLWDRALSADETRRLSENPWQLFRAAPRRLYFGAAGGPATITGTGALSAQAATLAGTAERELTATGALSAQSATVAGTGTVGNVVTGTGALSAQSAAMSGAATRALTGTGAIAAGPAVMGGVAVRTITGSGALAAQAATMTGADASTITGTAGLSCGAAAVVGTGTVSGLWTRQSRDSNTWSGVSRASTTWAEQ